MSGDSFRVCFCGNVATGKTTLVGAILQTPQANPQPTVAVDGHSLPIRLPSGASRSITIWDLTGQESYRTCTQNFFRLAQLAVIVFDQSVLSSFDAVPNWAQLVPKGCEIVLVGNKYDLERKIDESQGENMRARIKATHYLETSAKERTNTEDLRILIEDSAIAHFGGGQTEEQAQVVRETNQNQNQGCKC